ncbi:hypothetical protein Bhyg_00225 [Pseudolycoriella hygida]|uniref:UDP-glucose 6-dehydrogenase n=1 Tax=Pseudolycoriella hygida TaxID=35572 RepID=A0A9Q0S4S6_9DIPT|nr:hypothetical protein Bhyg_00225 [Pseudolycoriella hygida]
MEEYMTNNIEITTNSSSPYEEVAYESYPYPFTTPYHLYTLAVLFGMKPTNVETARILELGCSSGGNLIPHAINYPKAHFVGIDLSKVQIDAANIHKKNLELENLEFLHCPITDINEELGKFDYIICHGIFSIASSHIQEKILEISSKNLAENGIAYISYNTLPGWNMVRTIREMMLYHGEMFSSVQDKIAQARSLLEFVNASLKDVNSPYSEILKNEASFLALQPDHYLRYEYLAENNTRYYFHEFMTKAKKNSLQYLSDCHISTMYLGNMPPKVAERLKEINDIVRTEQYLDFITNRRFRATLLCHDNIKLNRMINNEDITKFNLIFNIIPEKSLAEINLHSTEEEKFFYNGNKDSGINTSSPYMKALFYTFSENINNPISFEKLTISASKKLDGKKLPEIKAELIKNAMRLVLQGFITITFEGNRNQINFEQPTASRFILYQVLNTPNMWVTNLRHELIMIDSFEKFSLQYMDGKHTKKQIVEAMVQHIKNGELIANRQEQKVENVEEIITELEGLLETTLRTGYVGLVSGTMMSYLGHNVTCLDLDAHKIAQLKQNILPIYEPGLQQYLPSLLASGKLKFVDSYSLDLQTSQAVFITVGTPPLPSGKANLQYIFSVIDNICPYIKKDCLIIIKSTVPPTTCNQIIDHLQKNNFHFPVASNPEFLSEGNAINDFLKPDRILIGTNSKYAEDLLRKIYLPLTSNNIKIVSTDLVTAELTKYACNSLLATKIAFTNEMANLCEQVGANITDLTYVMGLDKRIGKEFLKAGPGFGGSCFPKDLLAVSQIAQSMQIDCQIIDAVISSNNQRPYDIVEKIYNIISNNPLQQHKIPNDISSNDISSNDVSILLPEIDFIDKTIAVLGLTFKAGTDDVRNSPALKIIEILLSKRANIKVFDPLGMNYAKKYFDNLNKNLFYAETALSACQNSDIILITTEWPEFKDLNWQSMGSSCDLHANDVTLTHVTQDTRRIPANLPIIIDLRNILDADKLKSLGFKYYSIGHAQQF